MNTFLKGLILSSSIACPVLSQSVLLDQKQSTFFVDGGISGGEGLTSYNFGFGATYNSLFDVSIGFSRVTDRFGGIWGLGQSLGVNILRDEHRSTITFLSLNQSLVILEAARAISLGGSFSHQVNFEDDFNIVFSLGASWLNPLNSDENSIGVFPLELALSIEGEDSRLFFAPNIAFGSDNSVVYGVVFGLSFVQRPRNINGDKNRW
jgi:hypothetical protein